MDGIATLLVTAGSVGLSVGIARLALVGIFSVARLASSRVRK